MVLKSLTVAAGGANTNPRMEPAERVGGGGRGGVGGVVGGGHVGVSGGGAEGQGLMRSTSK